MLKRAVDQPGAVRTLLHSRVIDIANTAFRKLVDAQQRNRMTDRVDRPAAAVKR